MLYLKTHYILNGQKTKNITSGLLLRGFKHIWIEVITHKVFNVKEDHS